MNKRLLRIALSFLFLLFLWQWLAMQLDNDILIPYPVDVVEVMMTQVTSNTFYEVIVHTLFRTTLGFLIALIFALVIAFLAYFYSWFEDLCYPFLLLTRSIPNISYIIIVLFWFSSQSSVIVISFLILFPTIYANLIQGLKAMPATLLDVMRIYPAPRIDTIRNVYLPHLRNYLIAATNSGISLAFKVGIMAEILGQVSIGIGRQLNICRLNLDMAGVFAWTIWIIAILYVFEKLFHTMQKKLR